MADEKEFDLSEDGGYSRFRFDFQAFCIGQEIVGVHAWRNKIELHLASGRVITFAVQGEDIVIIIPVPANPTLDGTGKVN